MLPWQGIYAAGSGAISPAWRVVVALTGELHAGNNGKPGSSSTAAIDKKHRRLDVPVLQELVALADKAWREGDKATRAKRGNAKAIRAKATPSSASPQTGVPAHDPVGAGLDYGELLVVADGPQIFILDGQGPIVAPAAAALIKRLQAEAAR